MIIVFFVFSSPENEYYEIAVYKSFGKIGWSKQFIPHTSPLQAMFVGDIVVPYINPANQAHGVQTGHAPGVISSHRLIMEKKVFVLHFGQFLSNYWSYTANDT